MFHVKQDLLRFRLVSKSLGIKIGSGELEKFATYQKELSRWNKKINLISRSSDSPHHIFKHILDSILILKAVTIPLGAKILDFGSGAGFPGIPMKILRDDISLTLLESRKKKAFFLEHMIKTLKFKGIEVICKRAEDLVDSTNLRGKHYLVTAKAVGKLDNVTHSILPFLKVGGFLVAYKGKSSEDEIEGLSQREDFQFQNEIDFKLPEYDLTRNLIILKRIQPEL